MIFERMLCWSMQSSLSVCLYLSLSLSLSHIVFLSYNTLILVRLASLDLLNTHTQLRYAKNMFDISVSDRCAKTYVVDGCECNRNGLENHCTNLGYEENRCEQLCCDPNRNYRFRARNIVKRLMTNEYINRCWCEWANTETCRFEDGSRCHSVCCEHLKQSIQRDESRMERLLDYLDSRNRGTDDNSNVQIENEDVDDDEDYEQHEPQCDCGWASKRSCRHDDGTICHYVCCPRRKSKKHQIRHYFKKKKKKKKKHPLTLVEELRAMLRVRQRSGGGALIP